MMGFLIGVGCLIVDSEGKILLQKRKNSNFADGKWAWVGGKIKLGEKICDALKREVKEEIGVDIEIISDLSYYEDIVDSVHGIYFGYVGKILKGKPEILEPEKCDGLEWFNPNQLPEKTSDHTRVYIKRYQSSL